MHSVFTAVESGLTVARAQGDDILFVCVWLVVRFVPCLSRRMGHLYCVAININQGRKQSGALVLCGN